MKKYSEHLSGSAYSFDAGDRLIPLLNKQLADTIDLRSQVRQAQFNVRGPYLRELRSLFDGFARDLRHFADLIAQRITGLGGTAVASVRFAAHESSLREYPIDAFESHDHLQALLSGYSRYELDTRHNLETVLGNGDLETTHLLRVLLASIEKNLWFLEAYLEGIAVGLHGEKLPEWSSAFDNRGKSALS